MSMAQYLYGVTKHMTQWLAFALRWVRLKAIGCYQAGTVSIDDG